MKPQSIERLAASAGAVVALALGLQIAWWGWHFIAPPSASADAVTLPPPTALGRTLFGDGAAASAPAIATGAGASSIRLKGVFAVDGKTLSAAVVNLGGRDQTIYLKQSLASGATLAEVHADYIVLDRAGARERIDLDRLGNRPIADATRNTGPAPTSFRLDVANTGNNAYALSRQELNTVLQDPRQINFLGRIGPAPTGGVRVEDAPNGSLVNKLGLQAGDIITGINGQPVNSPGDLVRLYGQFDSLGTVRAELRRAGAPLSLQYTIKN